MQNTKHALGNIEREKPFIMTEEQLARAIEEADRGEEERKAGLEEKARKGKLGEEEKTEETPSTNISSIEDFWKIEGVNYRGKLCDVDLAKTLLDNGNTRTQDEWAEYSNIAIQKNEFYTGDMPLYHSVSTALFKQKDKPESEEARDFIQKQMREKYFMTLTRIAYQPKGKGKDKIIHNYNLSDKYELEENIFGKDRAIVQEDSSALTALLGDGDINRIKSVYNWINGTDAWIWRLNSKPKSIAERVARFVAGSDGVLFGCYRDPSGGGSSLGVRLVIRPKGVSPKI